MRYFRLQKRAISPVIATILLILIVISVTASAYYFYRDIYEKTTLEGEGNLGREINVLYAGLRISNVTTIGFNLVNSGSANLYDINIYEEESLIDTISSLAPGDTYSKYTSLAQGRTLYAVASYADDRRIIVAAPIISVGASISAGGITATGEVSGSLTVGNLPISSGLTEVD